MTSTLPVYIWGKEAIVKMIGLKNKKAERGLCDIRLCFFISKMVSLHFKFCSCSIQSGDLGQPVIKERSDDAAQGV